MSEPAFLLGVAPGRDFVLGLLLVLAGALGLRLLVRRRLEVRFVAITGGLERWILTALLLALIGLSAFQIIYRNAFGSGFVWIDPFLRSIVLWLTFLGAFTATAQGRHIGIDVAGRLLPARPRALLARGMSAAAAATCVALANGAYEYLSLERDFEAEAFLGLPSWQVQSILLIGFVLLAYRFALGAIVGVTEPTPGTGGAEPNPAVPTSGAEPNPAGPTQEPTPELARVPTQVPAQDLTRRISDGATRP